VDRYYDRFLPLSRQFLLLIYINDLSLSIYKLASPILFADDTTIITYNANPEEFQNNKNLVVTEITHWFQSNLLTMNYSKTHFMQFLTKKQCTRKIQIIAPNSINSNSTKFLGLTIDDSLSWKDHTCAITSKLNKACYAIQSVKPFLSREILRMVYFSYVHTVLSYGIIFWGNSHLYIINNVFKILKIIIRIISNSSSRDPCRPLFKYLQILSLPSNIFSLYLSL